MDVPDLHEGLIDAVTLGALFFDVQSEATDFEIQLKGAPTKTADPGACTLEHAFSLLKSRDVAGVQLRYIHRGETWCDTIWPSQGGFRVVRVSLDQVAAGRSSTS